MEYPHLHLIKCPVLVSKTGIPNDVAVLYFQLDA